jgi:glycosyltransferase involved in cell wall biosynthesis
MNDPDPDPLAAAVVISSRERPQMLVDTVGSILAADTVPAEIVIVDQSHAPQPELAGMGTVRGCKVVYVHPAAAGVSRGRNIGIALATQPVVIMLDDDMLAQSDSLEVLLAGRLGGEKTVTTGRVLMAPSEAPGLGQVPGALVTETEPEVFRGRQPRQVVPGPNIALPRAVMLEIGGYDERLGPGTRFPAAEDHDLSLRLLDAGCEVRHVPAAIVLHRGWRSRRERAVLRWKYGRGVGGFYAKHASLRDRHVLDRALREVRVRAGVAARSAPSSPKATLLQLVSLGALFTGALEWTLRYRVPRRFRSPER